MRPDAELSILGIVRLVAEFMEKLDLNGVILVGNDWGGAQLLVSERLDPPPPSPPDLRAGPRGLESFLVRHYVLART